MSISAYANTSSGSLAVNDDAYMIQEFGDYLVMAVADGSTSSRGMINTGGIAVTLCRDFFQRLIRENTSLETIRQSADSLFYMLSRAYLAVNGIDERYQQVNSSLAVLIISKITMQGYVMNIGSTEIQMIRNGQFRRLTQMHTEAFEMLSGGSITQEEMYSHPKRAVLTSALGVFDEIEYDIQPVQLFKDDVVFLSSDGLFRVTTPAGVVGNLIELSSQGKNLQECVDGVLEKANGYQPGDNLTLAVLNIVEDNGAREAVSERNYQNKTSQASYKNSHSNLNGRYTQQFERENHSYNRNAVFEKSPQNHQPKTYDPFERFKRR